MSDQRSDKIHSFLYNTQEPPINGAKGDGRLSANFGRTYCQLN